VRTRNRLLCALGANERQSWVPKAALAVLVAAGVLASGTGIANAATARHQTTAPPTVVSTGATLPANIIADATPYVVASGHHATVEAAAKQHLTAAEYTAVIQSVARFNSEPATLANTATKSGVSSSSAVASHSNAVRPMDGCAWSWNWTNHWYGWTFWMNDCAVDVIEGALLYGGGIAFAISALQGYLDIPYNIAATVGVVLAGVGAGGLYLQESACKAAGYGGVGYGVLWSSGVPYDYC